MIYYPLSVLMNAGIRDILIISTPQDTPRFEALLGDGHQFGVHLSYEVPAKSRRTGSGLYHWRRLYWRRLCSHGTGRQYFCRPRPEEKTESRCGKRRRSGQGATVFGYYVDDPERFGIVEFDSEGKAVSIEEKTRTSKE